MTTTIYIYLISVILNILMIILNQIIPKSTLKIETFSHLWKSLIMSLIPIVNVLILIVYMIFIYKDIELYLVFKKLEK